MAPLPSSTVSSSVSSGRMLAIYLRHHVAASRGGVDLFHRSARTQLSNEARQELRDLAAEVTQDREQLLRILRAAGYTHGQGSPRCSWESPRRSGG